MSVSEGRMFKEMEPYLAKYGIRVMDWKYSTRHRKVRVTDGRKEAMIVVSISPSDPRTYHNIAQSARNALREAR